MLSADGQGLLCLQHWATHLSGASQCLSRVTVEPASDSSSPLLPQDYQLDTSTLLSSPLLKRFTWTETKPKASMKIE